MANHTVPSNLAGETVKIKSHVKHPQVPDFGGSDYRVEDWWDRISGGLSWMNAKGNPACLVYAMRTGFSKSHVPTDDEVLYGKVGSFGHLVHISEIEGDASETPISERSEPKTGGVMRDTL